LGLAGVYLAVVTAVVAPIRDDARLVMRFGRDAIRR
jgi:hypothetical protein